MSQGTPTQDFTDEETARRHDETVKRMIATSPRRHNPKNNMSQTFVLDGAKIAQSVIDRILSPIIPQNES